MEPTAWQKFMSAAESEAIKEALRACADKYAKKAIASLKSAERVTRNTAVKTGSFPETKCR